LFVETIKFPRPLIRAFLPERTRRLLFSRQEGRVTRRVTRNIACDRRDSVIRGSSEIPNAAGIIVRARLACSSRGGGNSRELPPTPSDVRDQRRDRRVRLRETRIVSNRRAEARTARMDRACNDERARREDTSVSSMTRPSRARFLEPRRVYSRRIDRVITRMMRRGRERDGASP